MPKKGDFIQERLETWIEYSGATGLHKRTVGPIFMGIADAESVRTAPNTFNLNLEKTDECGELLFALANILFFKKRSGRPKEWTPERIREFRRDIVRVCRDRSDEELANMTYREIADRLQSKSKPKYNKLKRKTLEKQISLMFFGATEWSRLGCAGNTGLG
jgi:hypothetical protein